MPSSKRAASLEKNSKPNTDAPYPHAVAKAVNPPLRFQGVTMVIRLAYSAVIAASQARVDYRLVSPRDIGNEAVSHDY